MRRSSGIVSLMRSSPPVTPGERHEASRSRCGRGRRRASQPCRSARPVDGEHVRADALDVGAHLHEHPREVLDVRLAGGVADDGRARASARRPAARSRCHHRRLVHEDVARAQAPRRAQHRCRGWRSTSRPSARNASRCGSRRRRPITSPPGGGITARPKRASSGPASRNDARMRSDSSRSTSRARRLRPAAHSATSLLAAPRRRATPRCLEQREHRLDVADARHVADDDLVLGEDARRRGWAGRRSCCRPGTIVPDSGTPPSMTNFSMSGRRCPATWCRGRRA